MTMMMISSNKWKASSGQKCLFTNPSLVPPYLFTTRRRIAIVKMCTANMSVCNSKKANLFAARKERIKLSNSENGCHISEFLRHSSGIQAMLNTSALQSFQPLDANSYRCVLPKLELLNFEAAPVLDLRVTPTDENCTVEMLSCKFQGSEILEQQNQHFTAFMMNRMSWNTNESEPFLEVDVKLNLTLEIYTQPFILLPTSAVEGPGNFYYTEYYSDRGSVLTYRMMQALLDRLVPLLLAQLLQDYDKWANQQSENVP